MLKNKINFKKVSALIIDKRKSKLILLGNEIILGIVKRTQDGKDIDLTEFIKYSKGYAKTKRKEFGSATPNLTRTSKMLNNINYKDIENGIRFFFNSASENSKAYYNQVSNKREFFNIDKNQKQWIVKKLKKL